jgi:hypothetical protein
MDCTSMSRMVKYWYTVPQNNQQKFSIPSIGTNHVTIELQFANDKNS